MAPKSVTFRRHDHLVSVLFGDLLSWINQSTAQLEGAAVLFWFSG